MKISSPNSQQNLAGKVMNGRGFRLLVVLKPSLAVLLLQIFLFFSFFFLMGNKRLLDTYTCSTCTGYGFSFTNPLSTELLLGLIIVAAKIIMDGSTLCLNFCTSCGIIATVSHTQLSNSRINMHKRAFPFGCL